ncbi:MAG: glycosyl hydrolase [Ruminococcus sp.]
MAEQHQLQDAGVPIILRPLHEAQGNEGNYSDGTAWFWWGDRGAEVYKELWKLLYNTLTEKYNLHNIIWEYNSYNYANSDTWYPGDDYADIVAYDKYNCEYNRDRRSELWHTEPECNLLRFQLPLRADGRQEDGGNG